jgi:hypothetical protein
MMNSESILAPPRSVILNSLQKLEVPRVRCKWDPHSDYTQTPQGKLLPIGQGIKAWQFNWSVKFFFDEDIASSLEEWRPILAEAFSPFEIQSIDLRVLRDCDDENPCLQSNGAPAIRRFVENFTDDFVATFKRWPTDRFHFSWSFNIGPAWCSVSYGGWENEFDGSEEVLEKAANALLDELGDWFHGLTQFDVHLLRTPDS